ncbi:methyltransferase domain-containing protein [Candidatus Beckwithbacteria bacterium]|nr:methyltransferase domain-containing protein [Candidatus Beckwithbacteria bacterium]
MLDKPISEYILSYFRFRKASNEIKQDEAIALLDLGCGPTCQLFTWLQNHNYIIGKYVGIDPLVQVKNTNKQVKVIKQKLNGKLPFKTSTFDYVVGLAFLEHIDNPENLLAESFRVLKPGGKLIFTAPSKTLQPYLEFLARVGLVSRREIAEHKQYFDRKSLLNLVPKEYQKKAAHHYFQFGLNNMLTIIK